MNYIKLNIKFLIISIIRIFFPNSGLLNKSYTGLKINLLEKKWLKKYKNLKTKKYKNYFHFLSPIPQETDMKKFYSEAYQMARDSNHINPFTKREFAQFSFLKDNFNFNNKRILNFGCGQSGFSYLCKLLGAKVTEVDLKIKKPTYLDENIYFTNDIDNLKGLKFDLIYASHSLEHVTDIKKILKVFELISLENTCFFFEVPDGDFDSSQIYLKTRHFSHIYYYKKDFFKEIFLKKNKDSFLNIYDNENLNKYSNSGVKNIIVVWTNQKLNTKNINNLSLE